MDNVEVLEEFEYFFNELKVKIKVGKIYDEGTKQTLYFAKSNYKNIFSISELRENAIKYCIKKIKFKYDIIHGKIKLISEKDGIVIAKKYFNNYFLNRTEIKNIIPNLSFDFEVDDEILIINVTYFKTDDFENTKSKLLDVFVMLFVNLITGECELLENKKINI